MKLASALAVLSAAGLSVSGLAAAQSSTHTSHSTHTTASHTESASPAACAKLPPLSDKVPALPAGLPCARPLYTVSSAPSLKLDYVSPAAQGEALRETLGLDAPPISLNYIDVAAGTGELASPHKFYTIHYSGYLTDGTKFDSSYDRKEPFTIAYGKHQVIVGWDTGFGGMRVGGKRRLFIPWQLAYGPKGNGPIPPMAMLIFDVELVAVSDTPPAPAARPSAENNAPPAQPKAPGAAALPASQAPAAAQPADSTKPAASPAANPKP